MWRCGWLPHPDSHPLRGAQRGVYRQELKSFPPQAGHQRHPPRLLLCWWPAMVTGRLAGASNPILARVDVRGGHELSPSIGSRVHTRRRRVRSDCFPGMCDLRCVQLRGLEGWGVSGVRHWQTRKTAEASAGPARSRLKETWERAWRKHTEY